MAFTLLLLAHLALDTTDLSLAAHPLSQKKPLAVLTLVYSCPMIPKGKYSRVLADGAVY
jgi:hypothetical protein